MNYYDWGSPFIQSCRSYEVARRHGVKIFVMEPVKGGLLAKLPAQVHNRLQELNPTMSDASYGFRFAVGLDGVDIILSGMSSVAQVKDNISLAKNFVPLTAAEQRLPDISSCNLWSDNLRALGERRFVRATNACQETIF